MTLTCAEHSLSVCRTHFYTCLSVHVLWCTPPNFAGSLAIQTIRSFALPLARAQAASSQSKPPAWHTLLCWAGHSSKSGSRKTVNTTVGSSTAVARGGDRPGLTMDLVMSRYRYRYIASKCRYRIISILRHCVISISHQYRYRIQISISIIAYYRYRIRAIEYRLLGVTTELLFQPAVTRCCSSRVSNLSTVCCTWKTFVVNSFDNA
jgi:hypothetical protein